ncbi:hypothetical protein C3432_05365 [Citrobacter amalonaticus]|uniref:Uncharacterized protein n=1 Tax=Citrobacter amalonaticus TaxID=35703 RepID=A0A2S4RPV5_CITAM|nr:hypothetical protein [Citrobacter amalonaticus]POT57400.1 hypothetical protein C3432_05365 [Citrobacter amalonaticus]POT77073.1 hypothetical protein C3436_06455 [Citrobacter amalonaticus]POU59160.1 hypothetical protein C3430_26685 [Citrobacter amalonaticus]POV02355.1 hypothetical protein C3424_26750 [Citrobacter amalonaticus]
MTVFTFTGAKAGDHTFSVVNDMREHMFPVTSNDKVFFDLIINNDPSLNQQFNWSLKCNLTGAVNVNQDGRVSFNRFVGAMSDGKCIVTAQHKTTGQAITYTFVLEYYFEEYLDSSYGSQPVDWTSAVELNVHGMYLPGAALLSLTDETGNPTPRKPGPHFYQEWGPCGSYSENFLGLSRGMVWSRDTYINDANKAIRVDVGTSGKSHPHSKEYAFIPLLVRSYSKE